MIESQEISCFHLNNEEFERSFNGVFMMVVPHYWSHPHGVRLVEVKLPYTKVRDFWVRIESFDREKKVIIGYKNRSQSAREEKVYLNRFYRATRKKLEGKSEDEHDAS